MTILMKTSSTELSAKEYLAKYAKKKSKKGRYQVSDKSQRTCDDIVFDSKWEMEAYQVLKLVVGLSNFKLQPKYELQPGFRDPNGKAILPIAYNSDFLVKSKDGTREAILDTKGHLTDIFRLKEKLFLYKYKKVIYKVKTKKELADFLQALGYTFIHLSKPRTKKS